MRCAWQEFLGIVPVWMRTDVDRLGKDSLQELRLRIGVQPELISKNVTYQLTRLVTEEDLSFVINTASRYSPWAASTIRYGYITASGGHRIGICGETSRQKGERSIIKNPTSLCLRVARDFPGCAADALQFKGSILILGKPGSGKTTLLRDLIRQRSNAWNGCVAVVDERGELFPHCNNVSCFDKGRRSDVICGSSKKDGIDMVLRTMGPSCIAVDEITAQADCDALLQAGWCGVDLLATAHATGLKDIYNRAVYKPLVTAKLFDTVLTMQQDKSWKAERIIYDS